MPFNATASLVERKVGEWKETLENKRRGTELVPAIYLLESVSLE